MSPQRALPAAAVALFMAFILANILSPNPAQAQFIPKPKASSGDAVAQVLDAGIIPSSAQIVAAVQDAGVLPAANVDLYANAFIAQDISADGGTGGFAWMCSSPDCRYKLADGTSMTMEATGNDLTVFTSSVHLPTTFIQQGANPTNTHMRWFSDANKWFGVFPQSGTSGCDSTSEGGFRANSSDHLFYYCNGTAAQRVGFTATWSGAIDFSAIAGGACADGTFTATGAVLSEPVACGAINLLQDADSALNGTCAVSATNTVRVRACCQKLVGSCADPSSITFTATALR